MIILIKNENRFLNQLDRHQQFFFNDTEYKLRWDTPDQDEYPFSDWR